LRDWDLKPSPLRPAHQKVKAPSIMPRDFFFRNYSNWFE
jgi:hypothetical protein